MTFFSIFNELWFFIISEISILLWMHMYVYLYENRIYPSFETNNVKFWYKKDEYKTFF